MTLLLQFVGLLRQLWMHRNWTLKEIPLSKHIKNTKCVCAVVSPVVSRNEILVEKKWIRSRGLRKEKLPVFGAVVGLSRVQTVFLPSLIQCHETVWEVAGGTCQLIHWEFVKKPGTARGSISCTRAALPLQILLVKGCIVKLSRHFFGIIVVILIF